jgi:hypothetical protein
MGLALTQARAAALALALALALLLAAPAAVRAAPAAAFPACQAPGDKRLCAAAAAPFNITLAVGASPAGAACFAYDWVDGFDNITNPCAPYGVALRRRALKYLYLAVGEGRGRPAWPRCTRSQRSTG